MGNALKIKIKLNSNSAPTYPLLILYIFSGHFARTISNVELCISKPDLLHILRKLFYFLSTLCPKYCLYFHWEEPHGFSSPRVGCGCFRSERCAEQSWRRPRRNIATHLILTSCTILSRCFISPRRQESPCGPASSLRVLVFSVALVRRRA